MLVGEIVKRFILKDGRKVVLRTPKWEDLDGLLELINSLVDEGAEIARSRKVTREEEIDWLSGVIVRVENGKTSFIVAEVEGNVVAS